MLDAGAVIGKMVLRAKVHTCSNYAQQNKQIIVLESFALRIKWIAQDQEQVKVQDEVDAYIDDK